MMFYKDGIKKVERSVSENSRAKLSIVYVRSWSQKMHSHQKSLQAYSGSARLTPSRLEGGLNEDEHSGAGSSLLPSGSHIYFSSSAQS